MTSKPSERLNVALPSQLARQIKEIAAEMKVTPGTLAVSMLQGCVEACHAKRATMPPVVSLYRRVMRKGIDLVDKVSLSLLRLLFPDWEKEDDVCLEMLGRLWDAHIEGGNEFDKKALWQLGRKARAMAKELGAGSPKTAPPAGV